MAYQPRYAQQPIQFNAPMLGYQDKQGGFVKVKINSNWGGNIYEGPIKVVRIKGKWYVDMSLFNLEDVADLDNFFDLFD